MTAAEELGSEFARALAARDAARIGALLHPEVDFRALTPGRAWEASAPDAVLSTLFESWFGDSDDIRSLDAIETGEVADRRRVAYRLTVTNPDGRFVVEQQAYWSARNGQIDWMRVLCSGFRPVG
jgi:hypothetical protein